MVSMTFREVLVLDKLLDAADSEQHEVLAKVIRKDYWDFMCSELENYDRQQA